MTITSNRSGRGNEALDFQGERRKANELFGVHPLGCSLSIVVFGARDTLTKARTIQFVFLECGGRAQRRPRFGFFLPRRPHSPNGNLHRALPNGPSSPGPERFGSIVCTAAAGLRGPRLLVHSCSSKTQSPNGTAVERLPNGSPSPGGEGRGEGGLFSNCIVRALGCAGMKAHCS